MILINGENKSNIEVTDRALQYGDGLFETIAIKSGKAQFLDRHLKRLNVGCTRLRIPLPEHQLLASEVEKLAEDADQAVIKIIITRGSGGRGYRQPDYVHPTRIVSLHPYPDYPVSLKEQGIVARFCETRLGLNSTLAGIKHLNRLEQVMARSEWRDPAILEGIMFDNDGYVIEGTMTNLFYVKDNILTTAQLDNSGVAGIIRGIILELSAINGLRAVESKIRNAELLLADEVFVCNSIIGIWPVRQIEQTHFSVGPITQRIQAWLTNYEQELPSI